MPTRLDLALALNMHMAPGVTTDKAITVMDSHERNLSNQRVFNVGTHVRDELTMAIGDRGRLERQLDHNPGHKTSALEAVGRQGIDGGKGAGTERSSIPASSRAARRQAGERPHRPAAATAGRRQRWR